MRKDRQITIIRESTTKSSRPAGRLSVSLTEALLGDSLDPLLSLHEGSSINEKRAVLPGGNKENGKFIDRHPKFREFAANQSMNMGTSRSVSFDIDGIPDNSVYLSMNQNGIMRAYNGEGGNKEAIGFRSDTRNKEEEPALEITPDAPQTPPETSTNPGTVDPDVTDGDQEDLDADVKRAQTAADERWQAVKDQEDSEREYDSTFSGPGGERIPPPEYDGRETFVDDGGGDMDPDDPRLKDPQTASSEEEDTGRPEGESEGGDVIVGPPNGQGGGGQPQPPPTGDAKDVSDYIDKVAAGAEMVDLSEIRRPLHKRSLVELLYSS
jgi:hypothetical protein